MSEISLSRTKYLLSMHPKGNDSVSKWILYPILMVVLLGVALFFVWLGFYTNMIWIMYFIVSFSLLSFLNKDKSQEIHYLLLPASVKEKMIAQIIPAIGIPTMILAFLIPAIIFFQGLANLNAGQSFLSYMPVFEALTIGDFFMGFLLQPLAVFSTLTFRKLTEIKGLVVCLLAICIVISINVLLTKSESNIKEILTFLFNGILLILTIFIWIANYYKLKKREI